MPIPEFVERLREHVGHAPLWLIGASGVVTRTAPDGKQEVLLIRRSDDEEAWSIVSGIVEPGERPSQCIAREVAEEAGLSVNVDRLVSVEPTDLVTHENGDQAYYLDHLFACSWRSGSPRPDREESLACRWFRIEELPKMSDIHRASINQTLEYRIEARF